MTHYKKRWSDTERAEFEAVVLESIAVDGSNSKRAEAFAAKVADAIQAHRPWARDVEKDALSRGFKNVFRAEARKGTVTVMLKGTSVEKPAQVSVRKQSEDGVTYEQLAFFETLTRQQVADKRTEYLKQRRAYDSNIATMDKLAALMDAAQADDIETACAIIGVTVEEWLVSDAQERVAS